MAYTVRFDYCQIPDLDIGAGRTLAAIQRADLFGDRREHEVRRLVATISRILQGRASSGQAEELVPATSGDKHAAYPDPATVAVVRSMQQLSGSDTEQLAALVQPMSARNRL